MSLQPPSSSAGVAMLGYARVTALCFLDGTSWKGAISFLRVVCYKMKNRPVGPFALGSGMDFASDFANAAKVFATNQLLSLFCRVPSVASPIKQTTISQIDALYALSQQVGGLKDPRAVKMSCILLVQVRGLKAIL